MYERGGQQGGFDRVAAFEHPSSPESRYVIIYIVRFSEIYTYNTFICSHCYYFTTNMLTANSYDIFNIVLPLLKIFSQTNTLFLLSSIALLLLDWLYECYIVVVTITTLWSMMVIIIINRSSLLIIL